MNLIVSEVYDALIEAGASEEKAKAAAGAIPVAERLATQKNVADLQQNTSTLRTELKQDIANLRTELKQDIADLRTELKQDIADLRTELKGDIANLRAELKGDIANLRAELKGDIAKLTTKVARLEWAILVVLALLIKLVFFSPSG